ncbi:hypothetical protein CA13_36460 [Planctomycetes bacterium CA13]|uniref:DUF4139 domain-containing protein n=1 Tax=Novipirellula herctigrandis TaxID=2527986 RepID=A0A5C5Z4P8_9BACT|nr:hypothetical protein CA13_36460 [Planctomycetes bacterium CA13]
MMNRTIPGTKWFLVAVGLGISVVVAASTPAQTHGAEISADQYTKIDSVTLYHNEARVVREMQLPASNEVQQIRVPHLPIGLISGSATAESDSATTVRSLRIQPAGIVDDDKREKLDGLNQQHQSLLDEQFTMEAKLAVIEQDLLTIEKLVNFSSEKVQQNLDRATLDVDSVTSLAEFTMQSRRKLAAELHGMQRDTESLGKKIDANRLEYGRLLSKQDKRGFEALLAVVSPQGGWVRFGYVVGDVGWKPSYTLRATTAGDDAPTFRLQFDGEIHQESGEDWNDVALVLATSRPDAQSTVPILTPLRIKTSAASEAQSEFGASSTGGSFATNIPAWQDPAVWQRDLLRNTEAGNKQLDEYRSAAQVQRDIAADADSQIADETYPVQGRIDLVSQPEPQTVAITADQLTGTLYNVVTPLLSSFAYREAEFENTLGRNLIAGPLNAYLDEKFVGRTVLAPTAASQKLFVGFGEDRQLRTRRELLSREETIRGGNRQTELEYRLVVSNYHDKAVDVRLYDRIPLTAKNGAITVVLATEATEKLSPDPLYKRMQRPTGILRWDLSIPAKRFGSDAFDFEYQFSLELDKEQTVVGDAMIEKMRADYRFKHSSGGGGFGGGMGGGMGGGQF